MALWKFGLWALGALLVAGGVLGAIYLHRFVVLGSGFLTHIVCSGTFVSGRDPQAVVTEDVSNFGPVSLFRWNVDREAKSVTASLFGLGRRTALFREGLGCTVAIGKTEAELRAQAEGLFTVEPPILDPDTLWPDGERADLGALPGDVDAARLKAAVAAAFAEPNGKHRRNTRALLVVHRGRVVAERYAPGFDATMPLLGWSMAKTALNALVGVMVGDGTLKTSDEALLPQWREDGDPRREITLDQLLRMTSGLDFENEPSKRMLFTMGDIGTFAASTPLTHPPGEVWDYSQGPSNIIALIMRERFPNERDYLRFPRERLFWRLGMRSAVLEPDASGTFIGSSFMYASARDWARLGLLFLQDGVWQGRRILPDGWVDYTRAATPQSPGGRYGAHVWLRLPDSADLGVPPMPEDAYYMLGYDQQIVAIVPSRDLVIVRLGLTRKAKGFDHAQVLAPIVAAFPKVND